jgi:hypothetical protein
VRKGYAALVGESPDWHDQLTLAAAQTRLGRERLRRYWGHFLAFQVASSPLTYIYPERKHWSLVLYGRGWNSGVEQHLAAYGSEKTVARALGMPGACVAMAHALYNIGVLVLAVVGFRRWRREAEGTIPVVLGLTAALYALAIGMMGSSRYGLLTFPCLALLAGRFLSQRGLPRELDAAAPAASDAPESTAACGPATPAG